ncbi:hypothetical protein EXIGLDRAFT_716625 [Exidia glandulosa HHB12029]|uniref:Uncharacterized protein n=1 Tax=Exidia glandulosa HHB12029 TaxID=1314781 RepID=A0A165IU08_EXIGL|nr:hypothetical protein EXIGLDRAFT_716625 [Exidia glandulosa HHB12029]
MPAAQVISTRVTFLTSTLIESVLYGIALVLMLQSIQSLLRKRRVHDRVNTPLVVVAPLIFFFESLHMFGVWARAFIGFVTFPEGPDASWALITTTEKTLTQVGQLGAVTLGDAMMVYRAWLVWERRTSVVVLPALTFIATVVSGIAFVTVQHRVNVHTSIFQATVTRWTESWLASSLCTTGICTGLIVFKLGLVQYQLRDPSNPGSLPSTQTTAVSASTRGLTSRVMRIVVESAAMYSVVNLLYCVLYAAALNPEAWFSTMDAPVASISFSLIIIRAENISRGPTSRSTTSQGKSSWIFNRSKPTSTTPSHGSWPPVQDSFNDPRVEVIEMGRASQGSLAYDKPAA